jgi:hypothetical protein
MSCAFLCYLTLDADNLGLASIGVTNFAGTKN